MLTIVQTCTVIFKEWDAYFLSLILIYFLLAMVCNTAIPYFKVDYDSVKNEKKRIHSKGLRCLLLIVNLIGLRNS